MKNPSSSSLAKRSAACCAETGLKRGPWTPEEDKVLANYIKREGEGRWRTLPKKAGLLRCGKSCRLRWMNYLRPSVKRGRISPDEEDLILRLHRLLGNRWSLIAGRIPGRTDNEIKNYWNTRLSKKLIKQGIDPRTHKPLNSNSSMDNNASSSNADHILASDHAHQINYDTAANEDMKGLISNGDYDDDDDDLSSFLNSLINEDAYNNNQLQKHNNFSSAASGFVYGDEWDALVRM